MEKFCTKFRDYRIFLQTIFGEVGFKKHGCFIKYLNLKIKES
jgi:hypothetical protein